MLQLDREDSSGSNCKISFQYFYNVCGELRFAKGERNQPANILSVKDPFKMNVAGRASLEAALEKRMLVEYFRHAKP